MGVKQESSMLDQYRRIKRDNRGSVLFFRLGDFYEMFAEDAVEVSALLNLTLTQRNGLPMCGVPYHAARTYIARLLRYGKKVAICEQIPEQGKGKLIDRQVVEIITPGTTVDEDFLDKGSSNYLACLASCGDNLSFAYIDLSTGDFRATSFPLAGASDRLRQELERLQAREMLVQESLLEEQSGLARAVLDRSGIVLNRWADWLFDRERSYKRLLRQFGLSSLKGFGLDEESHEILAAGGLLDYLDDTAKSLLPHVRSLAVYQDSEYVGIDEASQRNLELVRNLRDGDVRFSLLEVMDETRTAMGRRLLKRRILHPLRSAERINARLSLVETLYRDQGKLSILRDILGKTPDLERLCSRLAMDKAHGKDMLAVRNALAMYRDLKMLWEQLRLSFEAEDTGASSPGAEEEQKADFSRLMEIHALLEKGICDEPSILLTEGNLIREGYSGELDQQRRLCDSGRQMLEDYLEEEKRVSGISSLKMRYNRLIGYFFEVTKTHLIRVPKHFIRRQGIAGGERFSTERLAAMESEINGAQDKVIELERKLFLEIREQAKGVLRELSQAAQRIAGIDTAQSLAKAASIHGWIRPVVDESNALEIYEGRHPVVEAHMPQGEYIPNDILLNSSPGAAFFALITGPNMAGKSTYLRSAALIALMAQTGSFVPAREARIGICDRIYCRVGASDNLARGESTFLVEMNETAYILNTATEKSLVIMDEVGRGTGTNDGLSIAWAVSEELLERVKCRTFFATHYHELSLITHTRMVNRSMEVLDQNGEIVFLRKLREGPAAESYGIHVARLAGLQKAVLSRAERIMDRLRERDVNLRNTLGAGFVNQFENVINNKEKEPQGIPPFIAENADPGGISAGISAGSVSRPELTIVKKPQDIPAPIAAILRELRFLDPNAVTPLEALKLLGEWKGLLAEYRDETTGGEGDVSVASVHPDAKRRAAGSPETEITPSLFDSP